MTAVTGSDNIACDFCCKYKDCLLSLTVLVGCNLDDCQKDLLAAVKFCACP
uniref:Uncharacterized protein n=1 Tax=Meloidogyne enterolobii TaxID=390850 RepID=A0A6V7TIC0_MELEN|nr:unnamed protein product [Meloidogyne enterolobii]